MSDKITYIEDSGLIHARQIAERSGLSEQVSFREGDLNKLPFDDDTFDWVWSLDSLWPGPKEMGCPAEDPVPFKFHRSS